MTRGPIVIDLEEEATAAPAPDRAPPVPEPDVPEAPEGRAMRRAATIAARRPSVLARLFWGGVAALLAAAVSVAAWDFAVGLVARWPVAGYAVSGLLAVLASVVLILALREAAALARLSRIDGLQRRAGAALAGDDLAAARLVAARLVRLYEGRGETRWARERLAERTGEQFDAAGLLHLAEREMLVPLDAAAMREVEAAARQVAMVTALVPLALADVIGALSVNLRMIRRIAEIYGGRSGALGSWRLARAVMAHLLTTGAVAIGDDMIGSIAGGGMLSKLSRRFGEGVVNGALTARVGVAAMEICRPLPFMQAPRPSVTALVRGGLTGLFSRGG